MFSRRLEVRVLLTLRDSPLGFLRVSGIQTSWREKYEANRGASVILTNTDWKPIGSERESNGCFCSVQLELP